MEAARSLMSTVGAAVLAPPPGNSAGSGTSSVEAVAIAEAPATRCARRRCRADGRSIRSPGRARTRRGARSARAVPTRSAETRTTALPASAASESEPWGRLAWDAVLARPVVAGGIRTAGGSTATSSRWVSDAASFAWTARSPERSRQRASARVCFRGRRGHRDGRVAAGAETVERAAAVDCARRDGDAASREASRAGACWAAETAVRGRRRRLPASVPWSRRATRSVVPAPCGDGARASVARAVAALRGISLPLTPPPGGARRARRRRLRSRWSQLHPPGRALRRDRWRRRRSGAPLGLGRSGDERDSTSENGRRTVLGGPPPATAGPSDGMSPAPSAEVATTVPAALTSSPCRTARTGRRGRARRARRPGSRHTAGSRRSARPPTSRRRRRPGRRSRSRTAGCSCPSSCAAPSIDCGRIGRVDAHARRRRRHELGDALGAGRADHIRLEPALVVQERGEQGGGDPVGRRRLLDRPGVVRPGRPRSPSGSDRLRSKPVRTAGSLPLAPAAPVGWRRPGWRAPTWTWTVVPVCGRVDHLAVADVDPDVAR